MPVTSPAAYTPGTEVAPVASTATNPSTRRQPSPTASSRRGVKPWPTHTASTATRRRVPSTTDQSGRSLATVTAVTRSSPCAATTAARVRTGIRWRPSTPAYRASSPSLPTFARVCGYRAQVLKALASSTSRTCVPTRTSDSATGSRNGPVPETTTRVPTATPWPFANACAAPAV